MEPFLIIRPDNRRVRLVGKSNWILGRGRGNDIDIDDVSISRRHAMFQMMEYGDVFLVDFGSRNGSFLNGFRISVPIKLNDGDRLHFGQTEIEFCTEAGPSDDFGPITVASTIPVQQRRMLSVLVVDIRDFTGLSRALGEQHLAQVIGSFFRRCGEVIRAHHSRIDKYIGDALMAVWFHDDQAQRDVSVLHPLRAACDIHRETEELNSEFELPFPLKIGAGINTGYAMVGNAGTGQRAEYTALGDTVNAAFRLESATKDIGCDLAIGDSTCERLRIAVGRDIGFERREVRLKGYPGLTVAHGCTFVRLKALLADSKGS